MPISQPTFSPADVTVIGATQNKITNLVMTVSGTEYSHSLQSNVKQLIIRSRGNGALQLAFTATESGTKYLTIPKGCSLFLGEIEFASSSLFLQSTSNNDVAEILELY